MLMLWAVFIVGPVTSFPVHHAVPMLWRTERECILERDWLLETKRVVISDPEFRLECVAVPDLRGDPA